MRQAFILFCFYVLFAGNAVAGRVFNKDVYPVTHLKVTTLSTMLANRGIGEWGYAALVEVEGKKILFDTGRRPDTVWQNAKSLGVELSDVKDVVLSHNHGDHTGGLLYLRQQLMKAHPEALSRIHVGKGIFKQRENAGQRMAQLKKDMEATGAEFFEYEDVAELFPGVWLTGLVERVHQEKNWSGRGRIITREGIIEDNIPEDMSLVVSTAKGFVLVSGCGHAGIINTMEHIQKKIHDLPISTAIGGFHLVSASDGHLAWTAEKLKGFGVKNMVGAHCTGIDALYSLRHLLGSDRKHMVVGSVGDHFDLEEGLKAGFIAR